MKNSLDDQLDQALNRFFVSHRIQLRRLLKKSRQTDAVTGGAVDRTSSAAVTPEQFAVLCILNSCGHGVAVKEIAESIDLPHANVTRTLDRLEKKGLVRRTAGREDRRQVIVRLTLEGTKEASRLLGIKRQLWESFWNKYDQREKLLLLKLLSK